ncbi:unnamed protein product [Triticum turgidum subsp. durum]|nr:unnamed protein product [Triticum turgidum subsp. durum]
MLASRIPPKRCTAAVPYELEPPAAAAEGMPPAKRRRERVLPSRFRDSAVAPPPAKKACKAPAPPKVEDRDGEVYEVEVRAVAPKGSAFGAVQTEVWTGEPARTEEELYRACRNISRSGSSGCFSGSVVTSVSNAGGKCAPEERPVVGAVATPTSNAAAGNAGLEGRSPVVECKPKQEAEVRREDFYWPEDFVLGDVVWARSGKKSPAWPALVINPLQHAPEVVLNSCVPGALCVMFFGYSAGGQNRDYGWVKQGMIFPFVEYLDRFQGQSLHKLKLKPSKFRAAIEEAFLAERGFFELQMDGVCSLDKSVNEQSVADGAHEVTGSNNEQECQSHSQVVVKLAAACCDSCGNRLPSKTSKKKKQEAEQLLCRHCEKLLQSKQYCGICKKIWHHTDGGNWVCCDECQIWVHVECDRTCSELEDLENTEYFCPDCKSKRKRVLKVEQTSTSNS